MISISNVRISITEILMTVTAAVFTAGIRSWFAPCGATENGFMACHWAGETVKALTIVFLILCVIHMVIRNDMVKAGLDIALAAFSAMTLLVPGTVISLCGDPMMMCRAHTQPWTIALSAVLLILSVADGVLFVSRASREQHRRKN